MTIFRTVKASLMPRQDADNVLLFLRSDGYICLKADSTITSADLYAILYYVVRGQHL